MFFSGKHFQAKETEENRIGQEKTLSQTMDVIPQEAVEDKLHNQVMPHDGSQSGQWSYLGRDGQS